MAYFGQLPLILVHGNIIIVIIMNNINRYANGYDQKPLLDCIMDILRFMDCRTKKNDNSGDNEKEEN